MDEEWLLVDLEDAQPCQPAQACPPMGALPRNRLAPGHITSAAAEDQDTQVLLWRKQAQDADARFALALQAEEDAVCAQEGKIINDEEDVLQQVSGDPNPVLERLDPSDSQIARALQAEEDAVHAHVQEGETADAAYAAVLQKEFAQLECEVAERQQQDQAFAVLTQAEEGINTERFTCSACLDEFHEVGDGILPPCSHVLCQACFTFFIQRCIDQRQMAECPHQACAQAYPGWLVSRLLGAEAGAHYAQIEVLHFGGVAGLDLRSCPVMDCSYKYEVDAVRLELVNKSDTCEADRCFTCPVYAALTDADADEFVTVLHLSGMRAQNLPGL